MTTASNQYIAPQYGNVHLMDPGMVNVNQGIINGIPQYQDMHIFAELIAQRKGRTVLAISSQGTSVQDNGMNDDVVVNFIGNNQDDKQPNPNYLNFTTNYYDGSSGDRRQLEGFGINSIKVVINSSYIPQVDIEFIDVRGLAFFNQEKSPYRILFDFPPPVFQLTLKGYYGMALEYKLHLVKYTSEFKSENGNFIINAQFVAITFAPLSDVLFRYVVNFPLITQGVSSNPSPSQEPKNTYELILKIKSLYAQYDEKKNTTPDTEAYNNIILQLSHNTDVMGVLAGYKSNDLLKEVIVPVMLVKNNSFVDDNSKELTELANLSDYDNYLKTLPSDGLENNLSQRLIIAYLISENVPIDEVYNSISIDGQNYVRINKAKKALDTYKKTELIGRANAVLGQIIQPNDIPPANDFTSKNPSVSENVTNIFVCIDVTKYYVTLYKQRTDLLKRKTDAMTVINEKINDLVLQNLGMKPTIYNIFKIILNDVDIFFNILRTVSIAAENHHTKYVDAIITDNRYRDVKNNILNNQKHIFSFPLVIKSELVCNQLKETRTVPIELSAKLTEPFPEIKLLIDFIDTFSKQQKITEQLNMRAEQNADGTNKWIPISPVDSKLATANMASPYLGVDNSNGGSQTQPINLSTEPRLAQVFNILMERFYILSQSSFADSFYGGGKGDNAVVNMFSESEAINLSVSITNTEFTNLLSTAAKRYGAEEKIDEFYTYLNNNIKDIYTFTPDQKPYFQITNGDYVYTDKTNPSFQGAEIYTGPISTQIEGGGTADSPIEKFQKETNLKFWAKLKNSGPLLQSFYKFTEENVFYIQDTDVEGSGITVDGDTKTRFLTDWSYGISLTPNENYKLSTIDFNNTSSKFGSPNASILGASTPSTGNFTAYNRIDAINKINENNNGNFGFRLIGAAPQPKARELQLFSDIVSTWVNQLSHYDDEILVPIISGASTINDTKLSAIVLMSSFGYALSPFNIYPSDLSQYIFNIPAAVQIPEFLPIYIGSLIDITTTSQMYKDIYDFFISGSGKNLSSSGAFIFADILDVNRYLSETDKTIFKNRFTAFYGNNGEDGTPYSFMILYLRALYDEVKNATKDITGSFDRLKAKQKKYEELLNSSNGNYFTKLLQPMMTKITLLNFTQLTYKRTMNTPVGYSGVSTTNANTSKKPINDNFFKMFFKRLASDIITQQNKIITQDQENKKLSGDDDILTQCYYSFKNINDKWLTGPLNTQSNDSNAGYPFGETVPSNTKLIDNFVFVDRAMNPIGDTIINPEILTNMMDNPSVSVFTVLSQILSMNGFEFFPLQNFLKYEKGQWEESFKIDTNISIKTGPTFVCMYIGGGSSYPTGIGTYNQFEDDGITDLSNNKNANDFWTYSAKTSTDGSPISAGCYGVPSEDNQTEKNKFFPFRQVRAFKVKFGEQNQSMFKDIKIDSKDYPETNESLHILSKLAGDSKLQAPPSKGQNLYNVYENRSYRATISGLGNVMIQPTQYFQLENVPLFNGAYIILSVEHSVEPNRMTTNFSGMKILEYPVPRVMQSSAILGFEGGNTDDTNPALSSANEVTVGVGTAGNPTQALFNSMYDFKIQ